MSRSPAARRRLSVAVAAGAAVLAGLTAVVVLPMTNANAATGLAALAEAKGRFFGTATDGPELTDAPYTSILTSGEFDQLTPGNQLKWQYIEPSQGQFNFTEADKEVNLGITNHMKVRGHNLVWHNQLAGWVNSLPLTQVQAAMENHITNEVTHFKGKLFAWDVVNEPFNDDGTYRTDVFYNAMGAGYIADALRTAHAADPSAKLYINDYNIEGQGAKSDALYNLATSLLAQGVPLSGIGFQAHLDVQYGFPTGMQANLQRFAALGLDVGITELDVRMPLPETAAEDTTQDQYYGNVVTACLAVSRCVGVTIWDYTDKYSWVPSVFTGEGAALPWDSALNKKPHLYNAITTALGGTATSPSASSPSPTPTATGGSSACHVTYTVPSQWNTGFVASVTIANTATTAISGWTLKWTFAGNQVITNGWNGMFAQSGTQVTVTNAAYNGTIAAGANTSLGFQGTYSGTNAIPTSFALNGKTCT